MPAIIDDPASPTIYRVSGEPPFPDPSKPALPASITPRQVTLRDKQTVATVVPFISKEQVPPSLLLYLADQFAKEIIKGDTYPMLEPMSSDKFASYWFQNFGAIMLLGNIQKPEDVVEGKDWSKECLGSFYIKPNYPGRSSHICNAGFLVTDASRNRGVGRLMGEAYLNWAPKLGYSYSVFNLVYETNVASCRIWDALGFKRIGKVPKCGNLKSYPGRLVDAIIYGRDLVENEESNDEIVSQERFDKIKFYLKHGKYPDGADRAEKSRLRSSATHYTLSEGDVLMFNNKECIADSGIQYAIAREVHASRQHGGINKTTAAIAEKYHWSRIKDTVSDVIRACTECNEIKDTSKVSPLATTLAKPPSINPVNTATSSILPSSNVQQSDAMRMNQVDIHVVPAATYKSPDFTPQIRSQPTIGDDGNMLEARNDNSDAQLTVPSTGLDTGQHDPDLSAIYQFLATHSSPNNGSTLPRYNYQPIDPQLMSHVQPIMYQQHDSHVHILPETELDRNAVRRPPHSPSVEPTSRDTNDRPVAAVPTGGMDAFFFQEQEQARGIFEGTEMDIDDNRELQTLCSSHDPYPEIYDEFQEEHLQYNRLNHPP